MKSSRLDDLKGGSQATTRESAEGKAPLVTMAERLALSRWYIKAAILLACMSVPLVVQSNYAMRVIIYIYLYIVLALGLNVVMGFTGLLNIGHAAFYAMGAYTTAILMTGYGVSFWWTVPIGMGLGVLMGLAIGFPTLRLRDDYLAMVTLGFGQIVYIVANNWMSLTRGPRGIPGIPAPSLEMFNWRIVIDNYTSYYYLILLFVALTIYACVRVRDSRVGLAWMAIREDEDVAAVMGIHLGFYKTLAFAFSAALGALAGSFFSVFQSFVSPNSFTILESVVIVTIPILGGLGSIPGTIVGAVLMIGLPEVFRSASEYRMVAVGAFMVLMMIFKPEGLFGKKLFQTTYKV
ncbi:MAG: branched-chain amino acid ABC transporter permease [Deltaproteobacteria bacterium]|nr:branched-chain amino acid ABC transporter permease [Deltaproteobacteria bacterium]NTV59035.1 branched-chain amino acid ABC transporter permease [Deltaproteobacteria bacterium]